MNKGRRPKQNPTARNPDPVPQPNPRAFNPYNATIYGMHHSIERGFGVVHKDTDPAERQGNGKMINPLGEEIWMYIEEMEANFEMAGTTGQSRRVRQFFPHNMVQPSITVRGRAPSNYEYNRLANFIRASQVYSVSARAFRMAKIPLSQIRHADNGTILPTIKFYIYNGTFQNTRRNTKGQHKPWVMEGYVKNMRGGAERFNFSPEFEFEYIIAATYTENGKNGIYADQLVKSREIMGWMDLFKQNSRQGFVDDPTPGDQSRDRSITRPPNAPGPPGQGDRPT